LHERTDGGALAVGESERAFTVPEKTVFAQVVIRTQVPPQDACDRVALFSE
jgi:hypothetical protein